MSKLKSLRRFKLTGSAEEALQTLRDRKAFVTPRLFELLSSAIQSDNMTAVSNHSFVEGRLGHFGFQKGICTYEIYQSLEAKGLRFVSVVAAVQFLTKLNLDGPWEFRMIAIDPAVVPKSPVEVQHRFNGGKMSHLEGYYFGYSLVGDRWHDSIPWIFSVPE